MADEQPRLDADEREYFARCLKSLLEHLEALRPLLGEPHPSDQSINAARQLVQSFVLKETGHCAWDGIFQGHGSKRDDVEAKRAYLREKTWGALPRVIAFSDDRVANSVSLSPPAYAAMKELLETLFHFSREWLIQPKIRTLAHELRDHAANFVGYQTGTTWISTDSERTTGYSPWIGSPELIPIMKSNNIKAANKRGDSDRTISRVKKRWGAEPQKGTNYRSFRFKLATLNELGISYPPKWNDPPT